MLSCQKMDSHSMLCIIEPSGKFISTWNRFFLAFCLIGLFVDPLFFYIPYEGFPGCISHNLTLMITVTMIRSLLDLLYLINLILKFRTAFVSPGSSFIGRGELEMNQRAIARHYLKTDFIIDFSATFPLPQILHWFIMPQLSYRSMEYTSDHFSLLILFQYIPRFVVIFPLIQRIISNSGFVTKTTWAGVAYNMSLYVLASHVIGASWYLLSIQRLYACWKGQCKYDEKETLLCFTSFLSCKFLGNNPYYIRRETWLAQTNVIYKCNPLNEDIEFKFGIFTTAFKVNVFSRNFAHKFFNSLWFGMQCITSFGQNLKASRYLPETVYSVFVCITGVLLFCQLIGNVQKYLQSSSMRHEDQRVKIQELEEWMKQRQLPLDLRNCIRRYAKFEWNCTRGLDEDTILNALPTDLRRDIKIHLSLIFIHRVPFIAVMDGHLQDAICQRLVTSLGVRDMLIIREGDPVDEMTFIVKGRLHSSTTDGGRSGFYNFTILGPGDFCGEELFTWAIMPNRRPTQPFSTRTVRALSELEGFALRLNDIKYIADHFKRIRSKLIQHLFKCYSAQWKTASARLIQDMWRWYNQKKRIKLKKKGKEEALAGEECLSVETTDSGKGGAVTVVASRASALLRKRGSRSGKKLEYGETSSGRHNVLPENIGDTMIADAVEDSSLLENSTTLSILESQYCEN